MTETAYEKAIAMQLLFAALIENILWKVKLSTIMAPYL